MESSAIIKLFKKIYPFEVYLKHLQVILPFCLYVFRVFSLPGTIEIIASDCTDSTPNIYPPCKTSIGLGRGQLHLL